MAFSSTCKIVSDPSKPRNLRARGLSPVKGCNGLRVVADHLVFFGAPVWQRGSRGSRRCAAPSFAQSSVRDSLLTWRRVTDKSSLCRASRAWANLRSAGSVGKGVHQGCADESPCLGARAGSWSWSKTSARAGRPSAPRSSPRSRAAAVGRAGFSQDVCPVGMATGAAEDLLGGPETAAVGVGSHQPGALQTAPAQLTRNPFQKGSPAGHHRAGDYLALTTLGHSDFLQHIGSLIGCQLAAHSAP